MTSAVAALVPEFVVLPWLCLNFTLVSRASYNPRTQSMRPILRISAFLAEWREQAPMIHAVIQQALSFAQSFRRHNRDAAVATASGPRIKASIAGTGSSGDHSAAWITGSPTAVVNPARTK
jgi:hypothetical protein